MTQSKEMITPSAPGGAPQGRTPAVFVLGSISKGEVIAQITCEISELLGFTADELVGRSLLTIVAADDRGRLTAMINRTVAFRTRTGQPLRFNLRTGGTRTCHLLVMPASPRDACAFVISASAAQPGGTLPLKPLVAVPSSVPDLLSALTARERQIVEGIARGDRVPAIARQLYLSRGTVRNHLSSAYRKLGVPGQQELVDLLRRVR
jgi:PAS domain S-box-containing protein